MADPASGAAAAATVATGLTLLGVATGLQPEILLAGLAGGLWALSYQEPAPRRERIAATILASIIAGYLTPAIAAGVTSLGAWPSAITREMSQLPIAVVIGLIAHRVLGPALLRVAQSRAERVQ